MMKSYMLNTLIISKDAYRFLRNEMCIQRGGKGLTDEQQERRYRSALKTEDGRVIVSDDSLGGGDGTKHGRWISWNCADLKRMLDDAGFAYEDGKPVEAIRVSI